MQKAKKYDWKDSNMALFGSDTDKQVKKESAETEPAWGGSGQDVGLQIWRVNKFKIEHWPKEQYGDFFEGDSYIILNTYKEPDGDELKYDVHFWIGKYSTQDEYGTAAYKTVELDTFHDDKPVQHREVQGHECKLFRSYFNTITYMKGGADTGFRRVLPEEYKPRLFHIRKEGKKIHLTEVPHSKSRLTSEDVFVLDLGLHIYQWNGSKCSHDEKYKAAQQIQKIKSERSRNCRVDTLDEDSTSPAHPFYESLNDDDEPDDDESVPDGENVLMRVSDEDGSLDRDEVKTGDISASDLTSEDVMILDLRSHLYVWVGSGASIDERKNGMTYASNYLKDTDYPWIPISVEAEGRESKQFQTAIAA